MNTLESMLAAVKFVVLVMVAALVGTEGGWAMAVPLMPLFVIHSAGLRWPGSMPSWLVFGGGLIVDLGTHGPLGYWALIYLAGAMVAQVAPESLVQRAVARAALALVMMAGVGLLQFVVTMAYRFAMPDGGAIALASIVAGCGLALLEAVWPYGSARHRGFGAETAALQRGE